MVAAVTIAPDTIQGDVPILVARDEAEREKLAIHVSNVLQSTVHDLGNGTYLIVQH
ncbi:capping complex subunit for YIEGIA [Desulfotomaculum sp. 1211_IL3151]|uniref:capping complex subunit for YIEGIA n=1 Tax=Desulfotomaculum sp. 1211_IL3151 TaxID=3084055 RepID=UPI003FA5606F